MMRAVLTLVLFVALGGSAAAESAIVDMSTPMTGKSIFAVDHEGRPVERGVPRHVEEPARQVGSGCAQVPVRAGLSKTPLKTPRWAWGQQEARRTVATAR